MGYSDSYAEGVTAGNQLGDNILLAPIQRQSAIEQLQAQRQTNALNAVNIQKQQMSYADMLGARDAAANAQGTPELTTTTVTPAPAQQPSAASALSSMSSPVPQVLQNMPAGYQKQADDIAGLGANVAANPGMAALSGADQRLSAMKADAQPPPALDASGLNPQAPASPIVQAYHDGRVQTTTTPAIPADKAKAIRDYWINLGNTDAAVQAGVMQKQTIDLDHALAKQKAEILAGGGDLAKFEQNKQELEVSKEMISSITPLAMRPATRQIAAQLLDGFKKTFPGNQALQGISIEQFQMTPHGAAIAVPDQNGNVIGHYVLDPASGNMKFEKSNSGEFAHNVQEITAPDGKTAQKFQYNPQTRKYDQPLGAPYTVKSQVPSVNVHIPTQNSGGSEEDNHLVAQMLAKGELSSSDVPKRGNAWMKTVAEAKRINPEFDPQRSGADNKNMVNLVKITGVLKSNELEANKNFDQLTLLYKKLGNGAIPLMNSALNRIQNNLGAPEPGTAEGVAYEAMTQYARVVNKMTGGAAITDTARKEANALLNVMKLAPAQYDAKVLQYRKTMKNAMDSQDEAIAAARTGRQPKAPGAVDTSRPVTKGSVTGYQQADGSVLDSAGKRLN